MGHARSLTLFVLAATTLAGPAVQAQGAGDLARDLANPVAALVSVPIQANRDRDIGPDDGSVWRTNIQPVVPISINPDWNLISRTIVPIVDQQDVPVDGAGESGLGDVLQSFFFSPKEPTSSGLIWGAGPALLLDTASDDALGSGQWGVGPTGVVLKQQGPWTYGTLANHIESVDGDADRADVSASFVQPFVSYITPGQTTLGINSESTYDWESERWSVPVNFTVNQLLQAGDQLFQLGGGLRYWVDSPPGGPEGWGLRLQLTLLFPR